MEKNNNQRRQKSSLKCLMRSLLAGTCLTAATAAHATTINESTDFSNTLAGAVSSPLPGGTNIVNGSVGIIAADIDYFDFTGLVPGGSFTLLFNATGAQLSFGVFDTANAHLGTPTITQISTTSTFTGIIPANGQLVGFVSQSEGIGGGYSATLTAPTVPEPATSALAGLGIAAAGLLSARRRKPSR